MLLRIAGWALLGLSLYPPIAAWGAAIGFVGWLGFLTLSAYTVALSLTYAFPAGRRGARS